MTESSLRLIVGRVINGQFQGSSNVGSYKNRYLWQLARLRISDSAEKSSAPCDLGLATKANVG